AWLIRRVGSSSDHVRSQLPGEHTYSAHTLAPERIDRDPAASISGVVRQQDGAPTSGADVLLMSLTEAGQSGPPRPLRTKSSGDGQFRFEQLRAGRYSVTATDHETRRAGVVEVILDVNESQRVQIVLDRPAHAVVGHVQDAEGGAVVEAHVLARAIGAG